MLEFCVCLCFVMHYFVSILVLQRKRNLVALLLLSYRCIVTVIVLWLFFTVPSDGLQCLIVVFPDHTPLLFSTLYVLGSKRSDVV